MAPTFTPDGYTEPLSPRPAGLAIGGVILLAGIGVLAMGMWCVGAPIALVGVLVAANEGGKRRIRATRSKLLIEAEYRIWGLLIGPTRDRIAWADTTKVERDGNAIRLESKDGRVLRLGEGGTDAELDRLLRRIQQGVDNVGNL